MKKALYVATVDVHIRTFHLPYLKLLHDNGYEVHVATNGNEQFQYCDKKYQICIERNPFNINNLKAIRELKNIIEREKYDLIHCHTPMGSVVARIAARKAAKKFNTRVIYTCHGFHFYKGASIKNWLLFYPIEKWLSKYTNTLITINQEDFSLAMKKFKRRCKDIRYVPGVGVDSTKFEKKLSEENKNNLRKKLKILNKDFVLIYPARLCKDKNQKLLLDFMKIINNKNVKLLLPGKDEYNGFYQKYVKENKINNIIFLGQREDIPDLLSISNLLVASSIREGFGINIVEALASKIPVIAVDNRGHREIVENDINGFIIKNDVNDLIDKFNRLYYDKDEYNKLKKNSYESSKKYFLKNSLKELKKIYNL